MLTGNGKGVFGAAQLLTAILLSMSVAVGNFDGDHKLDIATVGYWDRSYGVLLNTSVPVPPLKFTGMTASPSVLWSPNHKLVPITLTPTFTGGSDPVTWYIGGVSSNEPVNGAGSGNTSPDWAIGGNGQSLQLRAER